ncbi:MAG TPA: ATP-binding protein [Candidatus Ornithospirochaeta avicola]|uniref:ATP-binding protein n=1 Tax=Candidatus Ornithospirochaeta avicola TaxID=2840896 RepID=A0A9D1TMJ7_9SPIO|nr:ATP-binding protein [Candidatus Ornithospirochaeta avicola]
MQKKQSQKEEIINLAKGLASRFGLRLVDATIIALLYIIEKNDEVLIRSTIEARAADILNTYDKKEISDLVSRILDVIPLSSSLHLPSWFCLLFEAPRLPDIRKEEKADDTISSSFSFFQTRYNALKIMQIAIAEKKALYLKAENVIAQYGEQLIKYVFEENGIECVIAKSNSLDDEYYISEVLKASWNGEIVLFSNTLCESRERFLKVARFFNFSFCAVFLSQEDEESEEEIKLIEVSKFPTLVLKIVLKDDEDVKTVLKKNFSAEDKTVNLFIENNVNPVLACSYVDLVNTIFRKKNDDLIPDLLDNVERKRNVNDYRKVSEVLSKTYSTSFISSHPERSMIENMLCSAQRKKRALKLLFSGESGTGKTSFAYALAHIAGMKVISKCPEDIMFRYWGESEKAIRDAFAEAEDKNALLLFDEVESYVSRKENPFGSTAKAQNELTSCFMVALERYSGICIATTNYEKMIEPAVLRRFNEIVIFSCPDEEKIKGLMRISFPTVDFSSSEIAFLSSKGITQSDISALRETSSLLPSQIAGKDYIMSKLVERAEYRK